MSYEGYCQSLCKNGHLSNSDPFQSEDVCPSCQEEIVWSNSVDETNCNGVGYIPMDQFKIKDVVVETCNLGHTHITKEAVYRFPSAQETEEARTYRYDDKVGSLRRLIDDKKVGEKNPAE